ncbi:MAG: flagellar basal body P-ring formation protein FlgA, partial [Pyrinomonadaceae bacterium]|nr:flagellar basal body P-ring formation protein FlgA [Pyrinomonadaceae bacterium]
RVAYVRREGQQVPKELIRERVEDTLATAFKNNPIEVRITRLDLPDIAEVPFGTVEIETGLEKVRNLFEPFSLVITVRVDSRISTRFSAAVEIEAYAEVLTATSDLPANTKIRPQELIPVRKRLRKPSTEYLFTRAQAIGLKSSKEIRSGDAVTKSSFIADIVVKNGDRVRIIGTSGRMRLVVSGEALASGRIGDRISVKNLQSKKTVQAKIRGEGVVEIFF